MKASRIRYTVVLLAISLAVLSYVQRVAISVAAGPISHDLHLPKEQMGFIFGAFGLAYALFEIPMGLLGDRLGVRRVLTQIVLAWSVCTALTGSSLERRVDVRDPLPVRSRRGRLLSQPDAHAQRLAARARTGNSASPDVGFRALGRRDHAAAGPALHQPVRLAVGLCAVCRARHRVVCGVPHLVSGRTGPAPVCELAGKGIARGSACSHHPSGRTAPLGRPCC